MKEQPNTYMFVEDYTITSPLGCTLCKELRVLKEEKIIPPCLTLDDKVPRYIYDKTATISTMQTPYKPAYRKIQSI